MVKRIGIESAPKVACPGIRHYRHFVNYLAHKNIRVDMGGRPIEASWESIKCAIPYAEPSKRAAFIDEMTRSCESKIIPVSKFDLFKNDDRACAWGWGRLRKASYRDLETMQVNYQVDKNLYADMNINQAPFSTKDRHGAIIEFYDAWQVGRNYKEKHLEGLLLGYSKILLEPKPFQWLKIDDIGQCKWACGYLSKANVPLEFFNPTSAAELYWSIYARYDLWEVSPDTKKLFIMNINKAWSQKKHRDGMVGKKPLNTYLKEDVKGRLDELALHYDIKINQILERIINKEYNRMESDGGYH